MKNDSSKQLLLAEYDSTSSIYNACKEVKKNGYSKWDVCSPFPIHGLDKIMGLKARLLPWLVLCGGLFGCSLAMFFMIWASAYDYPLNISGKPLWSIPAFVPVAFEMTILFSALIAVFGMFALNKMPTYNHPLFESKAFEKVTDDKFFIVIESNDPVFDEKKTKEMLQKNGAVNIEILEDK